MLHEFNMIDGLLLAPVLLGALGGWRRGFVLGLLNLLHWAGSLLAAWALYRPVAALLASRTGLAPVWQTPLAFLMVLVLTGLVLGLLVRAVFRRLPVLVHRHPLNRFLGTIPGAASGLVTAVLVALAMAMAPLPEPWRGEVHASPLAGRFTDWAERVSGELMPVFDEALAHLLRRNVPFHTGDEARAHLPFRVPAAEPRPAFERQMLDLINQERALTGLPPLAMDPALTAVSRRHSADMFARGYFSHESPEGKSPFDRLRESGVRYLAAGENLALARTVRIAHAGLMNSPGHRRNILQPQYGRVGIGIVDGGIYGLMVTETFRN